MLSGSFTNNGQLCPTSPAQQASYFSVNFSVNFPVVFSRLFPLIQIERDSCDPAFARAKGGRGEGLEKSRSSVVTAEGIFSARGGESRMDP